MKLKQLRKKMCYLFSLIFLLSGCEDDKQNIISISNDEYSKYHELYKSNYMVKVDVNDFDIGNNYVIKKDNLTYTLRSANESSHTQFSSPKREEDMEIPSATLSVYDENLKQVVFSKKLFEHNCGLLWLDISLFKNNFYLSYKGICDDTSLKMSSTNGLDVNELLIDKNDASNLNFIETPETLYLAYNAGVKVTLFSISGKNNLKLIRINEDGTIHRYNPIKVKYGIYALSAFIYEKYLYFWMSVPAKDDKSYDSADYKKIKLEDI